MIQARRLLTFLGYAANSGHKLAAGDFAVNDTPLADDSAWNELSKTNGEGWVMVSPYGEFPNPVGLQIFGRTEADAVVKAFNENTGKSIAERAFGLPIFVGHPDVPDPEAQR